MCQPNTTPPIRPNFRYPKRTRNGMDQSPGPKSIVKSADSLARLHTEEAIRTLAEIMTDPWAKDADRLKAADSILDRGHGKPLAATITLPPSKLVLQQLAAMSDEELMNTIRRPLPRLTADEPLEGEFEEVAPVNPATGRDPLLD